MKKHFVSMAICFSLWNLVSFGAEIRKNRKDDFNVVMRDVANSIIDYALLASVGVRREDLDGLANTFKTILWPSLLSSYEKSRLSKRVIWLNVVREVRKYDNKEQDRPDRWYLGNLLDLTLGIENSRKNDAWMKGLRTAYRESF